MHLGLGRTLLSAVAIPGTTGMLSTFLLAVLAFTGVVLAGVPYVANVTSSTQNGAYAAGASIAVNVQFSEPVNVSGDTSGLLLQLSTGPVQENASYSGGNGTSTLSFSYVVQAGDSASPLDYASTAPLLFGSTSIVSASTGDAYSESANPFPAPGAAGSLSSSSNITIDTAGPTFDVVEGVMTTPVTSNPITIDITGATAGLYGFSPDSTCDASDAYTTEFSSGQQFVITGVHSDYLCVEATSASGVASYSLVGQLQVDSSPPQVGQIAITPSNGQFISNVSSLSAAVADSGSGISSCEYTVDGGSTWHEANYSGGACSASGVDTSDATSVNFRATSPVGLSATGSSPISVTLDTTPPQVDAGPNGISNSPFTPSASASDSGIGIASYRWMQLSGPGTVSFGDPNSLVTTMAPSMDGNYTLQLTATDAAGNAASSNFTLTWETAPPKITLNGGSDVTVQVGGTYTDAGATASDSLDGDLTSSIATSGSVNADQVGTYQVNYSVMDKAGNGASAARTVRVVDTVPPVIAMNGKPDVTVEMHSIYTDAGANATDNYDPAVQVISSGTVDTGKAGDYNITYSASDSSGNKATPLVRTVHVVDTTTPLIIAGAAVAVLAVIAVVAFYVFRKRRKGL